MGLAGRQVVCFFHRSPFIGSSRRFQNLLGLVSPSFRGSHSGMPKGQSVGALRCWQVLSKPLNRRTCERPLGRLEALLLHTIPPLSSISHDPPGAPWPSSKVLGNLSKTKPPQQRLIHLSNPTVPTSQRLFIARKLCVGSGLVGKTSMCTWVLICIILMSGGDCQGDP